MQNKDQNKDQILKQISSYELWEDKYVNLEQNDMNNRFIRLLLNQQQKYQQQSSDLTALRNPQKYNSPTALQNQIFIHSASRTIYLPGYLRIKLKNIQSINLQDLQAQVNCDIIFTIFYGQLSKKIVQTLKQKVVLIFQREQALKIVEFNEQGQKNLQIKQQIDSNNKLIKFTIRKVVKTTIQGQIIWTPFNVINLMLSIVVRPISFYPYQKIKNKGNKNHKHHDQSNNQQDDSSHKNKPHLELIKWTIRNNLMDHQNPYTKLSYNQQRLKFADFQFAPAFAQSYYSDQKLNEVDLTNMDKIWWRRRKLVEENIQHLKKRVFITQQQEDFIHEFEKQQKYSINSAVFRIPFFQLPSVSILTILLPLMLLGIINLAIFFQDQMLSDRIASIASLMIAFVALVPTIREKIPPNSSTTMIQIIVYIQTLTSLLAFFHSLDVRSITDYKLNPWQSSLYLITLLINIQVSLWIIGISLIFWFKWRPSYTKKQKENPNVQSFNRYEWFSSVCYQVFKKMILKRQNYKTVEDLVGIQKVAKQILLCQKKIKQNSKKTY